MGWVMGRGQGFPSGDGRKRWVDGLSSQCLHRRTVGLGLRLTLGLSLALGGLTLAATMAPAWAKSAKPQSANTARNQSANNWVRVYTNAMGDIIHVDKGSVKGRGRYRDFWVYIAEGKARRTPNGRSYQHSAYYLKTDCKEGSYRLLHAQFLNDKLQVIDEMPGFSDSFSEPNTTMGEDAAIAYVCQLK